MKTLTTRIELSQMLQTLNAKLPLMQLEHPEDNQFWPDLAAEVEALVGVGTPADEEWIMDRVHIILSTHGIEPPEGMIH